MAVLLTEMMLINPLTLSTCLLLGILSFRFAIIRWNRGPDREDKSTFGYGSSRVERIGLTACLGFALRLLARLDAVECVHNLIETSPKPILSLRISGKHVVIVKPCLDHELARHSKDMSLASFASWTLCKALFQLSDDGVSALKQIDTRPSWQAEFSDPENARAAIDGALRHVESVFQNIETEKTEFGAWLFVLSAGATARSLWGAENPWFNGDGLMGDFYLFQGIFESLYQPLPRVTANKAYRLRKALLHKLRTFQAGHKDIILPDNIHHRLNIVSSIDPAWRENPDYYIVELVTSLAILSTLGNITLWLVRHLFAHPRVLDKVQLEVEQLLKNSTTQGDDDDPTVDLGEVRQTCHWLVASWYEVLRLHMTGVPREAVRDFQLSGGESIRKGDAIFLPMAESNRAPQLWEHPDEFAPDRFIGDDGKVVYSLARKVKTFGVAGNLCPGRYHAFGVVMAVVVSMLLTLDVRELGSGWKEPTAGRSISGGGFDRCADETRVEIAKKEGWVDKKLLLKFSGNFFRS